MSSIRGHALLRWNLLAGAALLLMGAGSAFAQATTTLSCGPEGNKTNYEVSTGTSKGKCTKAGNNASVTCTDGGNSTSASCNSGCGDSSGAGKCTVKAAMSSDPPAPKGNRRPEARPPSGLLETSPALGTQGPAATGTPVAPQRPAGGPVLR